MRPSTVALDPSSFPIDLFRRLRFRTGLFCPRCGDRRITRWGRFGIRRRYRCGGCRRTFSDFTGTPLAYLKRIDGWPSFCRAFPQALSVRATARSLGLDKNTTFRWRRRLLDSLRHTEIVHLSGRVSIGQTWFSYSYKGARELPRPARRRRFEGLSSGTVAEWVVLATDGDGAAAGQTAGPLPPTVLQLRRALEGRILPGSTLLSRSGPFGAAATLAAGAGLRWERERPTEPVPHEWPEPATVVARRLKRWLRRFRGVATRYLDEYLVWFRLVDIAHGRRRPQRSLEGLLIGAFP